MSAIAESGTERDPSHPYRMKDLCELTGLSRQVIHFYLHEGLLPEGKKTGRNMAYYAESHLARIRLIRQLQHERFLPLKTIKAMLDEQDETFSPSQRRLMAEVKERLQGALRPRPQKPATQLVAPLLAQLGIEARDVDEMVEAGLLATSEDDAGQRVIASDDVWILSSWTELRDLGFTRDLGFGPADLAIFEAAVAALFKRETELLVSRVSQLGPERVAAMVERSLPVINAFLARAHEAKVRSFFATLETAATPK